MFRTSIPPLGFEDMDRDIKAMESRMKAKEAFGDAIIELMLCANVPEERKVELQIMKQFNELSKAAKNLMDEFTIKTLGSDKTPEIFEAQKAVRDYMGTVAEGLKEYLAEAVKIKQSK